MLKKETRKILSDVIRDYRGGLLTNDSQPISGSILDGNFLLAISGDSKSYQPGDVVPLHKTELYAPTELPADEVRQALLYGCGDKCAAVFSTLPQNELLPEVYFGIARDYITPENWGLVQTGGSTWAKVYLTQPFQDKNRQAFAVLNSDGVLQTDFHGRARIFHYGPESTESDRENTFWSFLDLGRDSDTSELFGRLTANWNGGQTLQKIALSEGFYFGGLSELQAYPAPYLTEDLPEGTSVTCRYVKAAGKWFFFRPSGSKENPRFANVSGRIDGILGWEEECPVLCRGPVDFTYNLAGRYACEKDDGSFYAAKIDQYGSLHQRFILNENETWVSNESAGNEYFSDGTSIYPKSDFPKGTFSGALGTFTYMRFNGRGFWAAADETNLTSFSRLDVDGFYAENYYRTHTHSIPSTSSADGSELDPQPETAYTLEPVSDAESSQSLTYRQSSVPIESGEWTDENGSRFIFGVPQWKIQDAFFTLQGVGSRYFLKGVIEVDGIEYENLTPETSRWILGTLNDEKSGWYSVDIADLSIEDDWKFSGMLKFQITADTLANQSPNQIWSLKSIDSSGRPVFENDTISNWIFSEEDMDAILVWYQYVSETHAATGASTSMSVRQYFSSETQPEDLYYTEDGKYYWRENFQKFTLLREAKPREDLALSCVGISTIPYTDSVFYISPERLQ